LVLEPDVVPEPFDELPESESEEVDVFDELFPSLFESELFDELPAELFFLVSVE
jgi:hypothetical protein